MAIRYYYIFYNLKLKVFKGGDYISIIIVVIRLE